MGSNRSDCLESQAKLCVRVGVATLKEARDAKGNSASAIAPTIIIKLLISYSLVLFRGLEL
jgi:hypothetical protein